MYVFVKKSFLFHSILSATTAEYGQIATLKAKSIDDGGSAAAIDGYECLMLLPCQAVAGLGRLGHILKSMD